MGTSAEGADLDVALEFLSQPLSGGPGLSIARFLDEDTVMRLSTGHVYLGIEGLIRFYQERTHDWQEARVEVSVAEQIEGGWVLAEGRLRLQPRGDGGEQVQPGAWLIRLKEGRVSDWLFFRTGPEARAAAAGPGDPRDFGREGLPANLDRGVIQVLGHGYELVCQHPQATSDQAFLLLVHDDTRLAAFAFPTRDEALAAVPPSMTHRGPEAVADQAVTAFINRDVSALIELLAEDFVYTDEERGTVIEGKAGTVSRLLLLEGGIRSHGLPDLRIEVLGEDRVRVSGLYNKPGGALNGGTRWTWSTTMGTEDGRIKWAVRAPNRPVATGQ